MYVDTLQELKNLGDSGWIARVNFTDAVTGDTRDKVYPAPSQDYFSKPDFLNVVQTDALQLANAATLVSELHPIVGQQLN